MGTGPAMGPTDIEARTMRKLRTRIIPFAFALFVVNFLDRANIAFAIKAQQCFCISKSKF
jgi:hypothetical protein